MYTNAKIGRGSFYLLLLLISLFLTACPEENPLLVNPPSQVATVRVRFLNLAGDRQERTLSLEDKTLFNNYRYLQIGEAINPHSDSSTLLIKKNGTTEFRQEFKVRFQPRTNYAFLAVPSSPQDTIQRQVDSIITLNTSLSRPTFQDAAFVRFANLSKDSTSNYQFLQGCPSGNRLASSLFYQRINNQVQVNSGRFIFSCIKNNNTGQIDFGTYELDLKPQGEYLIFVANDEVGQDRIYVLDFYDNTLSAMKVLTQKELKVTRLKVVNASSRDIELSYNSEGVLIDNLKSQSVSGKASIEVCKLNVQDTLTISSGGQFYNSIISSLNIGEEYVLVVADSLDNKFSAVLDVETKSTVASSGKSQVKAFNFYQGTSAVNITLGARDSSNQDGYVSGEIITDNLLKNRQSGNTIINSGFAPFSVFSTADPLRYVYSFISNLEKDNNYFLILTGNEQQNIKSYIIKDKATNANFSPLEEGVLCQLVNTVANASQVTFKVPGVLSGAKVRYLQSLATIVPKGSIKLFAENKELTINADGTKRSLLIASGNFTDLDFTDFSIAPINSPLNKYYTRFINVAKTSPATSIYNFAPNAEFTNSLFRDISYKQSTTAYEEVFERKLTYYFLNSADNSELLRLSDIRLTFGRNYSVLFANTANGGYTALIIQEF
jgi:hypothetical protein